MASGIAFLHQKVRIEHAKDSIVAIFAAETKKNEEHIIFYRTCVSLSVVKSVTSCDSQRNSFLLQPKEVSGGFKVISHCLGERHLVTRLFCFFVPLLGG